jgi:preprotein translocase subunit SecY
MLWLRSNASEDVPALAFNPQNPSMLGLVATMAAFLVIIYMEGVRVELPRGYGG